MDQAAPTPRKKVIPIVPYSVKGRYRTLKTLLLGVAFATYFALPWLTWHGEARTGQPLLIDLATLRVHVLDLVIYPQDLIILSAVLILAVLLLFVSATLYGRVFCGFFCFQTLWTDAFRFIERALQGEAQARLRLRAQPWRAQKIARVGATHLAWLALSFATAVTFTLYFLDATPLFARIFDGSAPLAAYTAIIALTASTYIAAGLAREQVCRVACPYGKFQSVMQDPGTVTVFYDRARGEREHGRAAPRGALKEAAARADQGYGDCVDCGYCVKVCPTGVDIRQGFQIDCIACGLCVDACDTIMDTLQLPRGLIRFDRAEPAAAPRFKLRAAAYAALILALGGFIAYSVGSLTPFDASVRQQAQPLATRLANGDVKNRYLLRITNKTHAAQRFRVAAAGLPPQALAAAPAYVVPAGRTYTHTLNVVLPEAAARRTRDFRLILLPLDQPQARQEFRLNYFAGL